MSFHKLILEFKITKILFLHLPTYVLPQGSPINIVKPETHLRMVAATQA